MSCKSFILSRSHVFNFNFLGRRKPDAACGRRKSDGADFASIFANPGGRGGRGGMGRRLDNMGTPPFLARVRIVCRFLWGIYDAIFRVFDILRHVVA